MDPERYYDYTQFRVPNGVLTADENPLNDGNTASVAYQLDLLSKKRPGAVLVIGYGNPLKSVVRAANNAHVEPLFTTGTDDKRSAFTFGGTSNTVSIGKKFDARLFTNDYVILQAADECGARTILCASNAQPSQLLAEECIRRDILLLVSDEHVKELIVWQRFLPEGVENAASAIAKAAAELAPVAWRRCARCGFTNDDRIVISNGFHCPTCGKLMRMTSDERIAITFDDDSVEEWGRDIEQTNALNFPQFDSIIERARERSGYDEGVRVGRAAIKGYPCGFAVMEPSFIMGSMGHVVGERLTEVFERATEEHLPVIVFTASGGARMQEGLSSLMQMAKVSAAVKRHSDAGLLYISVITDPTTGGVTASFATLGDIILAEPGAIIGFAGRRVIQDTIKQALPDDFQTAEFTLEHGLVDAIVERADMRHMLGTLLRLHSDNPCCPDTVANDSSAVSAGKSSDTLVGPSDSAIDSSDEANNSSAVAAAKLSASSADSPVETPDDSANPGRAEHPDDTFAKIRAGLGELASNLGQAATKQVDKASLWWALRNKGVADAPSIKPMHAGSSNPLTHQTQTTRAWESVQLARNVHRPTSLFYINALFDDFVELHGDRAFADDGAIVAGIGRIDGHTVTVIAEEKGSDLKAKIARNFGCPLPEGYRKSMRLMRQAEKFGRPVVCLVDTQGAFCGKEAEERGMGGAIAESLALMSALSVPVVSAVIGEGGSGGALALAVANKVGMQENAVYSVLSPEGFASILWKDGSRAPEAAEVMRMSAADALDMGMIEDVIPEGNAPAHENPDQAAAALWLYITNALDELKELTPEQLKQQRYDRFRKF